MLTMHINYPGDPSVGIFSASWEISDIELEDKEHREQVRQAFNEAFESVTGGGHTVIFSDELPPDWPDFGST